jgi:hypothetical protein
MRSEEIAIGRLQKVTAIFEIHGERIVDLVPVAENSVFESVRIFDALESWTLFILWIDSAFEKRL